MTLTLSRRELEERLRHTLRAKAAQVAGEEPSAQPDAPMLALVVDHGARRDAAGLRRAVAIAAMVAILAVATGVALSLRSGAPTPTPRVAPQVVPRTAGSVEHPPTGTILVPAQAPVGLRLWSMQTLPHQGGGGDFATTQLFGMLTAEGAPDPGILIETNPATPGGDLLPGSTNVTTVHGQRAPIHDSKDAGAAPTEVDWIEDGTFVRATVRGLDPLDAADILDQMQPRASGLLTGLDPSSAPAGLSLLGEHTEPAASARSTDTSFVYGTDAPSAGRPVELWVRTSSTYSYPGYLRNWIAGTGSPAGSANLDPDVGLFVSKPDGTTVVVGPASLPRDQLERVADSVTTLDSTQAAAMQASLDTRLHALPLLGTREINGVTLELRGNGQPTTLCLSTPDGATVCAPPVSQGYPGTTVPDVIVASVLVDGRWYVAAASTRQPWFGGPASPRDQPVIAEQSQGRIGDWYSSTLAVPEDLATIFVSADDPAGPSTSGLTITDPQP